LDLSGAKLDIEDLHISRLILRQMGLILGYQMEDEMGKAADSTGEVRHTDYCVKTLKTWEMEA
jgi:hypothetical protein